MRVSIRSPYMAGCAVIVGALCSWSVNAADGVFVKDGYVCDPVGGFCADRDGISVAITKTALGGLAAARLNQRIDKIGKQYFDPTRFTMSNGLTCSTSEQICYTNKLKNQVDEPVTQALFGAR